jgi:hypothetical protein
LGSILNPPLDHDLPVVVCPQELTQVYEYVRIVPSGVSDSAI